MSEIVEGAPEEPRTTLPERLARWLDRLRPSEGLQLAAAGIAVGLLSGGAVRLFQWGHEALAHLARSGIAPLEGPARWLATLGLPALGAALAGAIVARFVGRERHHGVAGVIESVALAGGRLRYWRTPAKALAAAVAIGGGASVGPEDPSVQLGASAGSMLGQLFRLSRERVRALVGAGTAAGLAAAFNAPIAGLFFAVEIVLGELGTTALSAAILAAVSAAALTQALVGIHPAFAVPAYPGIAPAELLLFLPLGLLAGLVAAAYVAGVDRLRHALESRPRPIPLPLRAGVAGLAVGALALAAPGVLGTGYGAIEAILSSGALLLVPLTLLVVAKLAATVASIGAGVPGGTFAPALVLGAALGGAWAAGLALLSPAFVASAPAFALVGMAAVLGAAMHAPLTAVLLVFELTGDYRAILPTFLGTVTALAVERGLVGESMHSLALARKGIRLRRGRDVDLLASIRVEEVAATAVELPPLPADLSLAEARRRLLERRAQGLAVIDGDGRLAGICTVADLDRAADRSAPTGTTVAEIATRDPLVAFPEESLASALERMAGRGVGRLPVVDPADPGRLVGLLRRSDVVRAYELARSRREAERRRAGG